LSSFGVRRSSFKQKGVDDQTLFEGNAPEKLRRSSGVVIPFSVYRRIVELCTRSGHNEVGWVGTMALRGQEIHIDDIFLPAQRVSMVTVDITGLQGVAESLISSGRIDEINRLHFWGHCHPSRAAPFPSGMDEETFLKLSESCPSCLMGIFSQDGRKAYFRLRHHGFEARLGWRVTLSESGESFPDFDDKVKPAQTFPSHRGRLGGSFWRRK